MLLSFLQNLWCAILQCSALLPGVGLSLEAWRWNLQLSQWGELKTVLYDAMNNFPPKRLPSGKWTMSRRHHQHRITFMLGRVEALDDWEIHPLAAYDGADQSPEEPCWDILPDGKNLVGLFRDNSGSNRIMRAFSTDNGESWTDLVRSNSQMPEASSSY